MKIKVNGKRLYEPDSIKYRGIHIDKSLTWKQQINHVVAKLIKASGTQSKSRQVFDIKTFRPVQYLSPIFMLMFLLFGQKNSTSVERLDLL